MTPVLLSLSDDSFIEEPGLLLTRLYGNFLASNHDQSTIYRGAIASFSYLVARYHTVPSTLCLQVENTLMDLMGPYFDRINEIQVTADVKDDDPTNGYGLNVYISVTKNSTEFNLAKEFYLDDGTLREIFKTIDEG
jgi:hypothetical protein